MRWRTSALALAALMVSGCAFADGDPWGALDPSLEAAFAPAPEHLTDEGWLETTGDYAVELEELAVVFGSLSVSLSGEAAEAFDPADPPPGYSNCHGGHCHADDGRLVPYEQVAVEAGAAGGASRVTAVTIRDVVPLGPEPSHVGITLCDGHCWLDRGVLTSVEVLALELRFHGRVFDLREGREGETRRLPEEGVAVEAVWPLEVVLRAPLEVPVDGDHPVGVRLDAVVHVPDQLFDGIEWAAVLPADPADDPVDPGGAGPLADRIAENLAEHGDLHVEVHRFGGDFAFGEDQANEEEGEHEEEDDHDH
ncbi:MAG: hypothetical protein ACQEXJ_04195 [Myxococcota bacterium]